MFNRRRLILPFALLLLSTLLLFTGCVRIQWVELTIDVQGEGQVLWLDNENGDVDEDGLEVIPGDTITIEKDSIIKLKPQAEEGWKFEGWQGEHGDDVSEPEDGVYTLLTDTNKDVTAVFVRDSFELVVTVDPEGAGTVEKQVLFTPEEEYDYETEIELTAIPNEGWLFKQWSGDAAGVEDTVVITMDSDKEVTAEFEKITSELTISVAEGEGTTEPKPDVYTYEYGAEAEIEAIPAYGWIFEKWLIDGVEVLDAETTIIMQDQDVEAEAYFVRAEFNLDVIINPEGAGIVTQEIVPALEGVYDYEEFVKLTAIAAEDWYFTEWTGDAEGSDLSIIVQLLGNMEVTANFEEIEINIEDLEHVFDGTPKEVTVTTVPENLNVIVTYNDQEDPPIDAGEYEVVVTIDEENFVSSTEAQMTIAPKEISVVADNNEKVFGEDDPEEFTFTATPDLVGADEFSGELTREEGEEVGTYDILQGTLELGPNYDLVFTAGVFEILPAIVELITDEIVDITVLTGNDPLESLGSTVVGLVNDAENTELDLDIIWTAPEGFDVDEPGKYQFTAEVQADQDYSFWTELSTTFTRDVYVIAVKMEFLEVFDLLGTKLKEFTVTLDAGESTDATSAKLSTEVERNLWPAPNQINLVDGHGQRDVLFMEEDRNLNIQLMVNGAEVGSLVEIEDGILWIDVAKFQFRRDLHPVNAFNFDVEMDIFPPAVEAIEFVGEKSGVVKRVDLAAERPLNLQTTVDVMPGETKVTIRPLDAMDNLLGIPLIEEGAFLYIEKVSYETNDLDPLPAITYTFDVDVDSNIQRIAKLLFETVKYPTQNEFDLNEEFKFDAHANEETISIQPLDENGNAIGRLWIVEL